MSHTEETVEQQTAYERGRKAGQVDSSLDQHEERLDKLNGSMGRLAEGYERVRNEIAAVNMGLQRLADEAAAAARTVLATATALKDERLATAEALKASTERSSRRWTPAAQIGTLLGALAAIIGAVVYVYPGIQGRHRASVMKPVHTEHETQGTALPRGEVVLDRIHPSCLVFRFSQSSFSGEPALHLRFDSDRRWC